MFSNCLNLTELNLSNFNIEEIKKMSEIFNNCDKLSKETKNEIFNNSIKLPEDTQNKILNKNK